MAKKTSTKISGAKFLSPGGGLIFCKECGKIVGSVNRLGYKYLYIAFECTCGNCGKIIIVRDGHFNDPEILIRKTPKTKMGTFVCSKCDTQLISMIDNRLKSYTFYTECVCGERYDTKPSFDTRLGETLKAFKRMKKE